MTGKPEVWFEKARKDMDMAKRAMGPLSPLPDMACYHAQQCAEKYLKGYLVSHQIEFRWVHDLVYLVQLCREHDSLFSCDYQYCYFIENTRYLKIDHQGRGSDPDFEPSHKSFSKA